MALFKFLAKIIKKIAKLFGGRKGKDEVVSDRLPGERRIGIYGPSAVGKSVFFTMLYNACRRDREFNLAPNDQQTGAQLLNNLNTLRSGEWLAGTVEESELNFMASLRGGAQFPFSSKDYKGELVDLEQDSPSRADLIAYFRDCDAILFLLSPEMIADEHKCEREILNFQAMINQVTESGGRGLRIPIGLMITKADAIPGFENENQVRLIARNAEYLKAKSFPAFVDGVCEQYHIKQNIVFQEQVRTLLESMSIFFDFLMTLSMEFQVFFLSSVGHVRTEEQPDGQTLTRPPENPSGIGVKRPFLWVVDTIRERERIAKFNRVRRGVFSLALVVLMVYSLVYGLHLLPGRQDFRTMNDLGENAEVTSRELAAYPARWTVALNTFFPLPGSKSQNIGSDARRLHATYKAQQFLRNEFTEDRSPEELRSLAEGFDADQVKTARPWFVDLSGPQQQSIMTTMATVIGSHNLDVAAQVEEMRADYLSGAISTTEDEVTRCDDLIASFVEIPANVSDFDKSRHHDTLVKKARRFREIMDAEEGVRKSFQKWDALLRKLPDICIGVPSQDRFTAFLDSVRELEDEVSRADSRGTEQLQEQASQLADLVRLFIDAIASPEDTRRRKYNRIVREAKDYPELVKYARGLMTNIDTQTRDDRAGELAAHITNKLAEKNRLQNVIDSDLERRVRGMRLSGPREKARQRYLDNLTHLGTVGVELEMRVAEVRGGCAVVIWDRDAHGFSLSQAIIGKSLKAQWLANQRIKIAVVQTGQAHPVYCPSDGLEEFVLRLHKNPIELRDGGCTPQTAGVLKVEFPEIEGIITEQLIEPLQEAFPE